MILRSRQDTLPRAAGRFIPRVLQAIARKEFTERMRSRWVQVTAVGFSVLAVVIAYLGAAPVGVAGFRDWEVTVISLTSLATYFVPLMALLLGAGVLVEERERGMLDLLRAMPVASWELLTGKYLGLALALATALGVGFGLAGVVLMVRMGTGGLVEYLIFMLNAVLLGFAFLSLAFLVSTVLRERSRVMAVAMVLWLVLVLLYDLGLMGLLILSGGNLGSGVFLALLLLNPVDCFRLMSFLALGEAKVFLSLTVVDLPATVRSETLTGVLLLWVGVPLGLSYLFFDRNRDEG